jgi:hypothetical protein
MSEVDKNKRSIRNLIINYDAQTNLFYWFLGLSAFFAVVLGIVIFFGMEDFFSQLVASAQLEDDIGNSFLENWNQTKFLLLGFLIIYVCGVGVLSITYTHRLVGPMVSIKKHIDELIIGNYSTRTHLREKDYFRDVAAKLNELAETLESKKP